MKELIKFILSFSALKAFKALFCDLLKFSKSSVMSFQSFLDELWSFRGELWKVSRWALNRFEGSKQGSKGFAFAHDLPYISISFKRSENKKLQGLVEQLNLDWNKIFFQHREFLFSHVTKTQNPSHPPPVRRMHKKYFKASRKNNFLQNSLQRQRFINFESRTAQRSRSRNAIDFSPQFHFHSAFYHTWFAYKSNEEISAKVEETKRASFDAIKLFAGN